PHASSVKVAKSEVSAKFEEVEKYLKQYCEQKGFEYRKRRVEYDNDNIVRKRTYECTKAAQYQPKKDKDPEKHRQRSSGSIGCQWHLNVTCPKSTEVIKISTIVDEHNHPLNPNIMIHGVQFRRFSEEMKSDILEYLTAVPTMGAQTIYRLLTKKYPDIYIHRKNLYNAIQEEDPGWVIETRLHTASLVYLTQQIHMRLEKERQYAEFEDQKTRNIMTSIPHIDEKFFGSIIQILKEFLTPNILIIAKKEISESILYEAIQISLNLNLDTLDFEYTPQDDAIENKYDYKKALLKDLMKNIPNSFIIEVWRVQPSIAAQLSESEIRASPSIQLFNTSQSVPTHSNLNLEYSYPDIVCGGNIFTPELKENVTDRQKYAKACGLQKKAYNLSKQLGQELEYINLLNNFILSMEVNLSEMNDKENTDEFQRKISNPIYVKPRGRPLQKRYKSSLEQQCISHTNAELRTPLGNACQNVDYSLSDKFSESSGSNNSRQMKKCGRCKQYAMHNRRTCNVDLSNLQQN
ncbi:15598_t:CDS:2, partial [Rhizophagus irregularis]